MVRYRHTLFLVYGFLQAVCENFEIYSISQRIWQSKSSCAISLNECSDLYLLDMLDFRCIELCYTFCLDDPDEYKPVIADGEVPSRGHGILSRWKEEKPDLKDEDEDDSSLPDLPTYHVPCTVEAQPAPQKRLKKRSDANSKDNHLNDSDGSSSFKSSRGSKGKAGGRGGKAKSWPTVDLTSPVKKEALTRGIVKKGALQAAIKLNQGQAKNANHTTEMRPASTSIPKVLSPTERNKKPNAKIEHASTVQQQSPATRAPLDDEDIIDVEVTAEELSQINKVTDMIASSKYKHFCSFVSSKSSCDTHELSLFSQNCIAMIQPTDSDKTLYLLDHWQVKRQSCVRSCVRQIDDDL